MNFSLVSYRKQTNLKHIDFEYHKEDKYLYAFQKNQQPIFIESPPLKVFKNIHEFLNDYYIILSLENEDDSNSEIYSFKTKLDNIYGLAQQKIKKNYQEIFPNYKGLVDNYIYENCIKRPFTGSRNQLIKIILPNDNDTIMSKIEQLVENDVVKLQIIYKGLRKIQGGRLIEEYYLNDFITENEWVSRMLQNNLNVNQTSFNVEIVDENIRENQNEIHHQNIINTYDQIQIETNTSISHVNSNLNKEDESNENIDVISIHENEITQEEQPQIEENNMIPETVIDTNTNINIEEVNRREGEGEQKEKKKKSKKDKEKRKEKEEREEETRKNRFSKKKKIKKEKQQNENENEDLHLSDSEDFKSLGPNEQSKVRNLFQWMKKK
jgi:hypothetical protein